MLDKTINCVYLLHVGGNSKKSCFERIENGEFFSSIAFPHKMRYRFETWGSWMKDDKEGLSDPEYL